MAGIPMEKIKPVLILSAIFALLLILLLVTGGADGEEERRVDPLVTMEADSISTLSIETADRPALKFSRTEDGWVMEEPLYSLASAETMQSVIETVDKLVGVPMEIDTSLPLEEFGLEGSEVISVTVSSRDGQTESFSLGRQIPLDVGYVYTYVPSSGNYYKAYRDAREVFTLPLEEYRDRTVLDLSISSIEKIRLSGALTGNTSPVIVEKQPPWWELSSPKAAPGNNGEVRKLLEGILSLRASDFPDSREAALQAEPQLRVEFTISDGSTEAVSFFDSYGEDLQYITTDRIPYALGIPRGLVSNLPISYDQLRSRAVLRFDPDAIQEIIISTESGDIGLKKEQSGWYLSNEQDIPADDAAVRQLINLLTLTDVEELPADLDVQKNNTAIQLQVTLTEDDGTQHWVELGKKAVKGEVLPGFSSFRNRPFAVSADFLEGFQIDADYFEDRHLLSFESRTVGSLEILGKNETIILEKSGSDWLLTEPERSAADSPKSWGLVFALEKLVYTRKLSADESATRGLSSEKPDYRIKVRDSEGKNQGSLDVWIDEGGGMVYASSDARDGLFVIDSEILERIPEDYTELIYRR
ncbi:hypothetical protein B4O97_06045 [Marispirochaeta aestuarii]|uniref:DUF4340 domain-containing protein n=1 Tax=Marispirochaeta aestuarii TaxID=1963862 RepID=A0A1Y1S0B4_9SPIO|nr:DUF4340 domain-containing protein [Marispirochaeta aestuarii]ORC36623.1 hypothetical protein B4O97_06045 [Marispirochaeta aestuarii]